MTLDELFRQREEALANAQTAVEELNELTGADAEAKQTEVDEKFSVIDQLDAKIDREERLATARTRSEERRETTQRVVENGGDLKYRQATPGKTESDVREVTMAERQERAELWSHARRGMQMSEDQLVKMRRKFPEEEWFANYLMGRGDAPVEAKFAFDPTATTGIGNTLTGSQTDVVPTVIFNEVVLQMKAWGPMLNISREIQTATGRNMTVPFYNNTTRKATVVAAGTSPGTEAVDFDNKSLNVFRYAPKDLIVTNEMIQDAEIDVEDFAISIMSESFGRGLNEDLLVGDGSSKPTGAYTATAAATGRTENSAGASGALGDVLDAFALIDPAYESLGLQLIISNALKHVIRQDTNTQGAYLWSPDLRSGAPATLYGAPVFTAPEFVNTGAGKAAGLVGHFQKYFYRVARQMTISRLVELYVANNAIGFHIEMRAGGVNTDTDAFAAIKIKT